MSFTGQDVMNSVANRGHKAITTPGSDDEIEVKEWVKQAIRYVQKADDWSCHKDDWSITTSTTPALTAGTYKYNMVTLKSDFRKLQGDSVRFARSPVSWYETPEDLDRKFGPDWKDGSETGVPRACSYMGNQLILTPNPSQDWIDQNSGGLHGYYYKSEDVTSADWEDSALLMFEDFFMDVVDVALIFALQTEDDSNFQKLLNDWEQVGLTRLRGYDPVPLSDEQLRAPAWARRRIA